MKHLMPNTCEQIQTAILKMMIPGCLLLMVCMSSVRAEEVLLLGAGSTWKQSYVFFPPSVSEASAKAAGKETDAAARQEMLKKRVAEGIITEDLPGNWMNGDFDDAGWISRTGLSFIGGDGRAKIRSCDPAYIRGVDYFIAEMGLLALRGKFTVKDVKQIKSLTCQLKFRGGFILYVNGKEAGRDFLPSGKISQRTPSTDYDLDVFAAEDTKGKLSAMSYGYYGGKEYLPLWRKRERNSELTIDASLLVTGINHIALEIHRSEYPIECKSKKYGHSRGSRIAFGTVGLSELFLKADTTKENVITGVARPAGFQVWNANSWTAVRSLDYGDPSAKLQAIKIAAARNGQFNGQVVVSSDTEIKNLKVTVTDLKSDKGSIAQENLNIRYAALNPTQPSLGTTRKNGYGGMRYDVLLYSPLSLIGLWLKRR